MVGCAILQQPPTGHRYFAKIHGCGPSFATLVGLVNSRTLPITVAVELFDLKIDSLLAYNRWLWITCESAAGLLDQFLDQCARNLLGADFWKMHRCYVAS